MRRLILGLMIIILLGWGTIKPLTFDGFFPIHDDTQVGRVVAMGKALVHGQFPVRWVSDLGYGYGYPIYNFYGPLPYYMGGFLYALGITGLTATKIMFAFGILGAGITMYLATSSFIGRLGAIVASVFYMYAPYHAVQVYIRGSVGEYWVLVFLPLLLWGITQSCKSQAKKNAVLVGGIGLAGAILSHTILGYITTVLLTIGLVVYWLSRLAQRTFQHSQFYTQLLLLATGLGISAFFWLPALFEMGYTNVAGQVSNTANYADHFVCTAQLWNSVWGYGGSAPGCLDGISFKLGKIHIIAALVGMFLARGSTMVRIAAALTVVSIFFTLPISNFLWQLFPRYSFVQYPWRFLTFSIFGLSVLSGFFVGVLRNRYMRYVLSCILLVSVLWINTKLFSPQYYYPRSPSEFETKEELSWRISKISDEYLPPQIKRPSNQNELAGLAIPSTGSLDIEIEIDRETYKKFMLMSAFSQEIVIHRAYFPGWHYVINGIDTPVRIVDGLPIVRVPEGFSTIQMRFTNTPIRTLGNTLSLVTVAVLLYIYGKKTYA